MTHTLPRRKPDPIPSINPVPEHAATGALADVYAQTKAGLGVPWMGVVAMAFAQYPNFYAALWTGLAPIVGTQDFADACETLRAAAEEAATQLHPAPLNAALAEIGYAPTELCEIRATIEVFSAGNMPYVLMATLARLLLEAHDWPGAATHGAEAPRPPRAARPPLMEEHHADPDTRALFADVKHTLGLPFVNTDYRALARWPSYFAPAWADLKRAKGHPEYPGAVGEVHDVAVRLARGLPNVTGLTAETLRAAAARDGSLEEVVQVVRLFQWLLPGLAVNVACLQSQLDAP